MKQVICGAASGGVGCCRMATPRTQRSRCPISIALEIFGDPWTLLVVRDLMFKGLRTFNEFLNAGEGIASNVLAERLTRLERAGIVTRHADAADARKRVYRLTRKGIDLAPVLVEIVLWSDRYEDTDAPPQTVHAMRTQREEVLSQVQREWAESGKLSGRRRR
ncbi:MAG: helix-turn-helix domain-containing protein [Myxococcota bacterium]